VAESFVLRNRQLLAAAKRYKQLYDRPRNIRTITDKDLLSASKSI